jgi:geranylgeranyl pyrophosphate synthase
MTDSYLNSSSASLANAVVNYDSVKVNSVSNTSPVDNIKPKETFQSNDKLVNILSNNDQANSIIKSESWSLQAVLTNQATQSYYLSITSTRRVTDSATHSHTLHYSMVDLNVPVEQQQHNQILHQSYSFVDENSLALLKDQLKNNGFVLDPRLNKVVLGMICKSDDIPLPDKLLSNSKCSILQEDDKSLHIQFDRHSIRCSNNSIDINFPDIQLELKQKLDKINIDSNYLLCNLNGEGRMKFNNQELLVSTNNAVFQYNTTNPNLDDGTENNAPSLKDLQHNIYQFYLNNLSTGGSRNYLILHAYYNVTTKQFSRTHLTLINLDTASISQWNSAEIILNLQNSYTSLRTTNYYPTKIHLMVEKAGINVEISADFAAGESISWISPNFSANSAFSPAYWASSLQIRSKIIENGDKTEPISRGFAISTNTQGLLSLDSYFRTISGLVLSATQQSLPLDPTPAQFTGLLASPSMEHLTSGVNRAVYSHCIIEPLRLLIDRGGKSWRSLCLLLCLDACGGNSLNSAYNPGFLAMPEIMHVGSLIIDDIQDDSSTRRGGEAAHVSLGTPLAINAGCSAYFLALHCLQSSTSGLDFPLRTTIYDIYFQLMRAGHCGQGLDIYNFGYLMRETLDSGDSSVLEQQIRACHRLKSGAAAGCLARIGSSVANLSRSAAISSCGRYFESIGEAFQIIDDCLNLEGFAGHWKERAEDIIAGKLTFPIAKAMNQARIAEKSTREKIWAIVASKQATEHEIQWITEQLVESGALRAARLDAQEVVEQAWKELDQRIENSLAKVLLRAFGGYVLQRKM